MSNRSLLSALVFPVIWATGSANAADVGAPVAPSNLTVTALGVNAFKLKWKDNSDNEIGWEVKASRAGGRPQHYLFIPTANIMTYTIFTEDLTGQTLLFQFSAYNGTTGQEAISDPTPTVAVKALSPNTFNAPTELTATAVDDGRVRLSWTDNSTSESGYQIEFKPSTAKDWNVLGNLDTALKYNIVASGLDPSKSYSFRTRAYQAGGAKLTGYSDVAEAKTKSLRPPIKLVAIPGVEGSFSFKWKDRSSAESGFELQEDTGNGKFKSLGNVDANTTTTSVIKDFPLDQDLKFRMRTYRTVGTDKTYSSFSNIFSAHSTPLNMPPWLNVKDRTDTSISLRWKDKSERETAYRIDYRRVGTTSFSTASAPSNSETYTVSGLDPGRNYEFRVRASDSNNGSFSPPSEFAKGRTREGIVGNLSPILSVGVPFTYTIKVSDSLHLKELMVSGLPDGLTFDPVTGKIKGTVNQDGTFNLTITAMFEDGTTSMRILAIRTTTPPVIADTFAAKNVVVGASTAVSVSGKFQDPDTASAARFLTNLGSFDIIFFPSAAPKTVNNFIDYMDAMKYDNVIVHRAPPGFVVQTGGYKYTKGTGFTEVVKLDPVMNEPGISNLRGTVAMAKIGGMPDSATSEWFVNLGDNSANLDSQNGGFTVFGRIPDKGMTVIDKISNLPTASYTVTVDSVDRTFEDLPINDTVAPAVLPRQKLVKILSTGPAPILTYRVKSANKEIATARLSGKKIIISGVASGSTYVQVFATDLDANTVSQEIPVTVP